MIDAQLDLFLREHRDVLEDVATRLEQYNAAERDEAEELYGDYVDAVETGTELLATCATTTRRRSTTPSRICATSTGRSPSGLPEYALEIENR